jgi:hypothetical protein
MGSTPQLPHGELSESDYVETDDGAAYEVAFSVDDTRVEIGETPLVGTLSADDNERLYFDLQEGTFAGGRFVVWATDGGLEAELTIYGSGVPIIKSERGPLSCQEE